GVQTCALPISYPPITFPRLLAHPSTPRALPEDSSSTNSAQSAASHFVPLRCRAAGLSGRATASRSSLREVIPRGAPPFIEFSGMAPVCNASSQAAVMSLDSEPGQPQRPPWLGPPLPDTPHPVDSQPLVSPLGFY